jgi:acetyltransferase
MILFGLGGIFIEVLKDVRAVLAPITKAEVLDEIKELKSYKIIQGVRGMDPVDEDKFADIIVRLSALVQVAPEIVELDLNPLLGSKNNVVAVVKSPCVVWIGIFNYKYNYLIIIIILYL